MNQRRRLPDTRPSVTRKVSIDGEKIELYVNVGFYDNDQPGEIFVTVSKEGDMVRGLCNHVAVLSSMLLQVGVPWSQISDKWRNSRFGVSDQAFTSVLDAVARTVDELVSERGGSIDVDYDGEEVDR